MYTLVCSLKICCSLLGYSIVVVQWALNSPVLVRFKVPQPYKNTLAIAYLVASGDHRKEDT